ncbi:MAG: hypothetical protein A2W29_10540 [Gemmatimonadetes bacterium RBG_16_66_8]|nr:MAG: hypothetical protein A2W29_10540 [Gemmatimonadetes bacterium RBG_16_66_8]
MEGDTRVAVVDTESEFVPGAIVGGLPDDPLRSEYRVYRSVRWSGNPADSSHLERTPEELAATPRLDPLAHHSWSEYVRGAIPFGGPSEMYLLADEGTPDPADSVAVLGPRVWGSQTAWAVYNDADPSRHVLSHGSTAPLRVEVRQTTFLFASGGTIDGLVYFVFRIRNHGSASLQDAYVGIWCDPDLGGFADDLVGSDPALNLGYCYNSTNNDAVYGPSPPAVGWVLLGPLDKALGTPLGATAFVKYTAGSDPVSASETNNGLKGLLADGSPVVDPTSGQPTRFMVSGDPVAGTGWLDAVPGDRRFVLSSGRFRLDVGEEQVIIAALIIAQGSNRLTSVSALRELARAVGAGVYSSFVGVDGLPNYRAGGVQVRAAPNPMRSDAALAYFLSEPAFVRLAIYSATGRLARAWAERWQEAGPYAIWWDGRNDAGLEVEPGMYLVELCVGKDRTGAKLVVVR